MMVFDVLFDYVLLDSHHENDSTLQLYSFELVFLASIARLFVKIDVFFTVTFRECEEVRKLGKKSKDFVPR